MNESMATVFGLLGGLALFIFGMNMMSESLQKVAGDKMKKVLGVLTRNAVCGMLAGALVTAVLQSSSATTVLVIGFVSAGLMSLKQGISVIFGANIGTTMTAQLMAFKISDYIMPIVFIGFLIAFIAKKEKIKFVGQTIFAFGLLFVGIEMMGDVMKPLATSPVFINMMEKVSHIPVLGVGVGMLMTLVVQSSSATIAVLQSFASQAGPDGASVIGLVGAIPILLGDNIGTTITAILASIGQSKDAKRCAIAHSVFNITGSFLFIWIIKPFAKFVEMISPKGNELDVISRQIANAHMSFNIINTLIWLPLLPVMVKIVMFIVRDDKEVSIEDYKEKSFLDKNVISQPIAAMYLVSQEIRRAGRLVSEMIGNMKATVMNNDSKALAELEKNAKLVTEIDENTVSYISGMFSNGSLTEEQSSTTAGLLYVLNDIARVSKRCEDASPVIRAKLEGKYKFSKDAVEELGKVIDNVEIMYRTSIVSLENGDTKTARKVFDYRKELRNMEKKFNKNHLKRLRKNNCKPEFTYPFSNVLHNLERIGDSCSGIVEEVMDNVRFLELEEA
ncbi:Na/Pi cotransporter family protein [Clostridium sp. AF15-6B]|jgi:Na/Pi-cotransporter II-like protein|nr:Na/Pi cotransporter family protein [Clostridium sp. AF16-25]RGH03366.1 Na/Pi cotransporter family protein [Clostridium sp. AF15-6B]RGH06073.1 Na/Pi cotransporter family protein [Clostridium sp. AF15-49]